MQVTNRLQESSVLSKAMNLLQVQLQGNILAKEVLDNVSQHELISGVVGRPFACVVIDNGQISFFSKINF